MKQSNFFSLNWRDALRGLLVAVIAVVFEWLQTTFIPELNISPELKLMAITALAYLSKNFFTKPDSKIQTLLEDEEEPIVGDRPIDR